MSGIRCRFVGITCRFKSESGADLQRNIHFALKSKFKDILLSLNNGDHIEVTGKVFDMEEYGWTGLLVTDIEYPGSQAQEDQAAGLQPIEPVSTPNTEINGWLIMIAVSLVGIVIVAVIWIKRESKNKK